MRHQVTYPRTTTRHWQIFSLCRAMCKQWSAILVPRLFPALPCQSGNKASVVLSHSPPLGILSRDLWNLQPILANWMRNPSSAVSRSWLHHKVVSLDSPLLMAYRLLVSCSACYVGSLDIVLLWKQKLVKSSRTSLSVADQHVLVYTCS